MRGEAIVQEVSEWVHKAGSVASSDLLGHVVELAGPEQQRAAGFDAASLFDIAAEGNTPRGWRVVARPGQPLRRRLRAGDVVVRRALGEGRLAHVAVLADETLLPSATEWTYAEAEPAEHGIGVYAVVVEGQAASQGGTGRRARLLLDEDGTVRSDTAVMRVRRAPRSYVESAESIDPPKWVRDRVRVYLESKPYLDKASHKELKKFFKTTNARTQAFAGWVTQLEERLQRSSTPSSDLIDMSISAFFRRDQIQTIESLVRAGGTEIASPRCSHQGLLFTDYASFLARQSAWREKLERLKLADAATFWGWVQGALTPEADTKLKAITNWKTTETDPCQAGGLHADAHAATIESRSQLDLITLCWKSTSRYPLWKSALARKISVASGFRSRSDQMTIWKKRSVATVNDQRKRMFGSSAPTLSRHHWGTDYDLFETSTSGTASLSSSYNKPFQKGKKHWEEWGFLTDFGHLFGLVQPYVGSTNAGEKDTRNSPPGSIVGLRGRLVPLWKRVIGSTLVTPADTDLRGYLEERWHWSYAPVAQAMTSMLRTDDNLREFHRRSVAYWSTSPNSISEFEYPKQYGLDYVFNVAEIDSSKWV